MTLVNAFVVALMVVAGLAALIGLGLNVVSLGRQLWRERQRPTPPAPVEPGQSVQVRRRESPIPPPSTTVTSGGDVRPRASIAVKRDQRPLWEVRGWRRDGNKLIGAYRTPRGSFAGEISLASPKRPEFFIVNPPPALLKGPHGSCFRRRGGGGRYFVHWWLANPDIDAGIVGIEKLIARAL